MSAVLDEDVTEDLLRHKPAFIRRVQIRGYKSIAFCDVTLEPLTILVGRNASGKSNFLDALAFVRDVLDEGANAAVVSHGGESVFSRTADSNRMYFDLEAEFGSYGNRLFDARYSFDLVATNTKQVRVEREFLRLKDRLKGKICSFTVIGGKVTWAGLENFSEGFHGRLSSDNAGGQPDQGGYPSFFDNYKPDRLLLGIIGSQPFLDLAAGLRTTDRYNFIPDAIRPPRSSFGSPVLERDGSNLARAIEGLKELEEETVDRVAAYLNAIIPEIIGFDVIPIGDYETIRFKLRAPEGRSTLELNATSMSDGTLRVLASLIAAYQVQLPEGLPGLVAIEEPESSLHPAAMNALVDALDEATLRTQILLTTHSAEMLDNPTIQPENIRVVQMIDGETVIGPVDAASVDIVRRQLNTLGGLERDNLLEPDLGDLQRQQKLQRELRGSAA